MEDTHIHWSISGVLSIMNAQANLGNLICPLRFIHSWQFINPFAYKIGSS